MEALNGEFFQADGIACVVRRKNVKNLWLRLRAPDGPVEISAPPGLSLARIGEFVKTRTAWIARQRQRLANLPPAAVESRERVLVWGKFLPVRLATGARGIALADGAVVVSAPHAPDAAEFAALLRSWRARLVRAAAVAPLAYWRKRLAAGEAALAVRHMRRRWGTCYPDRKKIILNSALAARPRVCLAFVITHELLHLAWPDHGPRFRAALAAHWPRWRELDRILDYNGEMR